MHLPRESRQEFQVRPQVLPILQEREFVNEPKSSGSMRTRSRSQPTIRTCRGPVADGQCQRKLMSALPTAAPSSRSEAAQFQSSSGCFGKSCNSISSEMSFTGEDTTYCPLAHLPRSMRRQRSLQKGKSSAVRSTAFLQMGQLNFNLRLRGTTQF